MCRFLGFSEGCARTPFFTTTAATTAETPDDVERLEVGRLVGEQGDLRLDSVAHAGRKKRRGGVGLWLCLERSDGLALEHGSKQIDTLDFTVRVNVQLNLQSVGQRVQYGVQPLLSRASSGRMNILIILALLLPRSEAAQESDEGEARRLLYTDTRT
eukprot:COSAG05_NODE_1220_length_5477_cov_485.217739_5_plen_157_part_00